MKVKASIVFFVLECFLVTTFHLEWAWAGKELPSAVGISLPERLGPSHLRPKSTLGGGADLRHALSSEDGGRKSASEGLVDQRSFAKGLPRETQRALMPGVLSTVFQDINGIAAVPVLYHLARKGLFGKRVGEYGLFEDSAQSVTLRQISETFNPEDPDRNAGNLYIGLRALALQGWLKETGTGKDEDTAYTLTPQGRVAIALTQEGYLDDVVQAIVRLKGYREYFRGPPSKRPQTLDRHKKALEEYVSFVEKLRSGVELPTPEEMTAWGVIDGTEKHIAERVLKHMNHYLISMIRSATIVALSFPGSYERTPRGIKSGPSILNYLDKEGSIDLDRLERLGHDRAFLEVAFRLFVHQGFVTQEKGKGSVFKLTDLGKMYVARYGAYGVPFAYMKSLQKGNEMFWGNPDPWGISGDHHLDRLLDIEGSRLAHETYLPVLKAIDKAIFDRPIDEQYLGMDTMGAGSGHIVAERVKFILGKTPDGEYNTERGKYLKTHPFVVNASDYSHESARTQRITLEEELNKLDDIEVNVIDVNVASQVERLKVLLETPSDARRVIVLTMGGQTADVTDQEKFGSAIRALGFSVPFGNTRRSVELNHFYRTLEFITHERGLKLYTGDRKRDLEVATAVVREAIQEMDADDRGALWDVLDTLEAENLPPKAVFVEKDLISDEEILRIVLKEPSASFSYGGPLVPAIVVFADMVQFFKEQSDYSNEISLLELHTPRAQEMEEEVPQDINVPMKVEQIAPVSYQITQGFSRQWIQPFLEFKLAAVLGGYNAENPKRFPTDKSPDLATWVSVGIYERRRASDGGTKTPPVSDVAEKAIEWLRKNGPDVKRYPPAHPDLLRLQKELIERSAHLREIERERAAPGRGNIPDILVFSDPEGRTRRTRAMLNYAEAHGMTTAYIVGDLIARGEGGHAILQEIQGRHGKTRIQPTYGGNEIAFLSAMMGDEGAVAQFFLTDVGGGQKLLQEVGATPENFRYHPKLLADLRFIQNQYHPFHYDLFHGLALGRTFPISSEGQIDISYLGAKGAAGARKVAADIRETTSWKGPVLARFFDLMGLNPSKTSDLLQYVNALENPEALRQFFEKLQVHSQSGHELMRFITGDAASSNDPTDYENRIFGVDTSMDRGLVLGREGIYWIRWDDASGTYQKDAVVLSREAYLDELEAHHRGWIEAHAKEIQQRIRADELAQRQGRYERIFRWIRDDASRRIRGFRYDLDPERYLPFMNDIYQYSWYIGRGGVLERGDSDVPESIFSEYQKLFETVGVEAVHGEILLNKKTGKAFYIIGEEKDTADRMDVAFLAWVMLVNHREDFVLLGDDVTRAFVLGTRMFGGTVPLQHIGASPALTYRNQEGRIATPKLKGDVVIPREGFYEISHIFYINQGTPSRNLEETKRKLFGSQAKRGHFFSHRFANDALQVSVHEIQIPEINYGRAGDAAVEDMLRILHQPSKGISPLRRTKKLIARAVMPEKKAAPHRIASRDGGAKQAMRTAVLGGTRGLHLELAQGVAIWAGTFKSHIQLQNTTEGTEKVDGKDASGVLSLNAWPGDEIQIFAEGEDAEEAVTSMKRAIESPWLYAEDGGHRTHEEPFFIIPNAIPTLPIDGRSLSFIEQSL